MKSKLGIRPRPADILLFIAVLAAAFILMWLLTRGGTDGLTAVIEQDGELIERVELNSLSEPMTVTVTGEYNTVIVLEKGGVYVSESDCPNGDCISTGVIDRAGQCIVCLPNRVSVTLEGSDGGIDAYAG